MRHLNTQYYSNNQLKEVAAPTESSDAATKGYVDAAVAKDVTYSELVSMAYNSQLKKGAQYRITDYVLQTPSTSTGVRSANHPFDIIVTANSESTVDENARAVLHEGDTYFANSDLGAWKIKYALAPSGNTFNWYSTGKGCIFYMEDEWGNICHYDFKNMQFKITTADGVFDENGMDTWLYTFSAAKTDDSYSIHDATMLNRTYGTGPSSLRYRQCSNNCIETSMNGGKMLLSLVVFLNRFSDSTAFTCDNNRLVASASVIAGNNCSFNTFGQGCMLIYTGDGFIGNTLGNYCYNNYFGDNCTGNSLGNLANNCHIGSSCRYNSIGNYASVTMGDGCQGNSIGDGSEVYSGNIILGASCSNNSFGEGCRSVSLGSNCTGNSFGNRNQYITFGDHCDSNRFSPQCEHVYAQDYCLFNEFEFCSYIYFGTLTTRKSYYRNIKIQTGCVGVVLNNSETADADHYLQNVCIAQGVKSKTIDTITCNRSYRTTVAIDSTGTLRIYNEDDAATMDYVDAAVANAGGGHASLDVTDDNNGNIAVALLSTSYELSVTDDNEGNITLSLN